MLGLAYGKMEIIIFRDTFFGEQYPQGSVTRGITLPLGDNFTIKIFLNSFTSFHQNSINTKKKSL